MKYNIVAFFLLFIGFRPLAATAHKDLMPITDEARFTLLTCSPGPDLYSLFGHTAIRLEDYGEGKRTDMVFNYGTFDFNTENFYLKFTRGQLPYKLTVTSFADFQVEYIYTGRGIWEQELLLTTSEKRRLLSLLNENLSPENVEYRYDFFYDNCSTRVRDIVLAAITEGKEDRTWCCYQFPAHCNNALLPDAEFTYTYPRPTTFRQAIQSYLDYQPWSDFGIDLALGVPCDRVMQHGQAMFLPDSLLHEFHYAIHNDLALVKPEEEVLPKEYELESNLFFTPVMVFTLFLLLHVIVGWWWLAKKKKSVIIIDRIIFFVAGLVGVVVVFLWFFTDHGATKLNLNILWANPLLLLFAFLPASKWTGWIKKYIITYFLVLMLMSLCWFFLPQRLHIAVFPITFSLGFTCLKWWRPAVFSKMHRGRVHSLSNVSAQPQS